MSRSVMPVVVALALLVPVTPLAVGGKKAGQTLPHVALVAPVAVGDFTPSEWGDPYWRAFVHELQTLGWTHGRDVVIELRSLEGKLDRAPALFAEVVREDVDVIVTVNRLARAAKAATDTIPIVIAYGVGLADQGLISTLARPGGNLTGLEGESTAELQAKRFQLLKEAVPGIARVAVLASPNMAARWPAIQRLLEPVGLQLVLSYPESDEQLAAAFARLRQDPPDALFTSGAFYWPYRDQLSAFALATRLPQLGESRWYVEGGALISYGADTLDMFRQAAGYVDRILRGAKPGNLPVERPRKFDLVINLKTAKTLGLTIPQSVLVQADEVIE